MTLKNVFDILALCQFNTDVELYSNGKMLQGAPNAYLDAEVLCIRAVSIVKELMDDSLINGAYVPISKM